MGFSLWGRFPLWSHGMVAAATLVSAHLHFGQGHLTLAVMPAAITFVLLMVQLRLVDDLDDLDVDMAAVGASSSLTTTHRRRLRLALGVVIVLTIALNVRWPLALLTVLVTSTLVVATPKLKPYLLRSKVALAMVYEASPALALTYGYVSWSVTNARSAGVIEAMGVVALLWTGYEFWKFSRKYGLPVFQPYALSTVGTRRVMWVLLCCAPVFTVLAAGPGALVALVVLASVAFAGLLIMAGSSPRSRPPIWSGLPYLCLVSAAVSVSSLI